MTGSAAAELKQLLRHFRHGMLVTHRGRDVLRSRPMALAGSERDGRIWLITSAETAKVEEVTDFPMVNVALQAGMRFLSVSGTARVSRDPEKVRELWDETQRVWFEGGRLDPRLALLEITPSRAEYWDRAGVNGLRFLLAEARAMLTGRQLSGEERGHRELDLGGG